MSSPDDTKNPVLKAALVHHEAGRLAQAEAGYRRILADAPDDVPVLQLLAVLSHQGGDSDTALALLRRVTDLDPDHAAAHANLAIVLEECGDLKAAAACRRRVAALRPQEADAWKQLARVTIARGDAAEAGECLRRAAELQPAALPDPALEIALGNLLLGRGDIAPALACYERAVTGAPDLAIAHSNLGNALRLLYRLPEAVASLERARTFDPALAEAQNNLGIAYLDQGRLAEAAACFERALALRSDFPEAHSNLGNLLQVQGRLEAAIAAYDRALALRPDYGDALINRGNALRLRLQLAQAIASYERAVALRPGDLLARAHLALAKVQTCAWDERDAGEAAVLRAIETNPGAVAPFDLLGQRSTPADQLRCAEGATRRLTAGCAPSFRHRRAAPRRPIRLGYLSADFRDHPVGWAVAGLFPAHDRTDFEVYAYSYGADDGSAVRTRIVAGCDRFRDLSAVADDAAARCIHADGVDILIDLTGYTLHARPRIPAFRPAPVQVSFLGYVATMGAGFVDAIIVDPFVVPPDQQPFFTEQLVPVPCWWPAAITPAIAERTLSRAACGLPAGFVFACFNNSFKITPEMFELWMGLLTAVPGSVLWLVETNRLVAANLRREAARHGVAPERLVFAAPLPLDEHIARHRHADLFLDTLPFNACSTAYYALWAGLPVLTCAGATFAGRMAGSMLHRIELPELVVASLFEYEQRALELAREPAVLGGLRERLERARTTAAFFDITRGARDLEAAFARLWDGRCASPEPTSDRGGRRIKD